MADTDINLSVDLDIKDAEKTAQELQKEIEDIFKSRGGQQSASLTNLESQMKQTYNRAEQLREKLGELATQQVATDDYKKVTDDLQHYIDLYDKLIEKNNKYEEAAGDGTIEAEKYQELAAEMERVEDTIGKLTLRKEEMEKAGTAFISGKETEEYKKMQIALDATNDKLKQQIVHHTELTNKAEDSAKKVGNSTRKMASETKKSSKSMISNLGKVTKRLVLLAFGVRGAFALLRKMRTAIIQGFEELKKSKISAVTDEINNLKASLTTFRNALVSAFEPLIRTVVPYIQMVVDKLTEAIDKMAQFFAALAGQKTYIKAIKKTGEEIERAGEKAEGSLASFDKLNVINAEDKDSFEESGISAETLDIVNKMRQGLEELKKLASEIVIEPFKQGFEKTFDAKGLEKIKTNLERIKTAIKNIVTDPRLASLKTTVENISRAVGTLTGAIANIASTLTQLFTGAIAAFLEGNGSAIVGFIVNVSNQIATLTQDFADFIAAIAVILEPLASDAAINIIATALGAIYDVFLGLLSLGLDVLITVFEFFTKPITENADGFAAALQGVLDILAPLVEVARAFLDDVLSGVLGVWDQIKGVIEEVGQWLSDLTGIILEWWNNGPGPMLQGWAEDIKNFYYDYISPVIDELFGVLSDLVGYLGEVLAPVLDKVNDVIEWFLDNVWPILQEALEAAWEMIKGVAQVVAVVVQEILRDVRFVWGAIHDIITGDFKGLFERAQKWFDAKVESIKKIINSVKNTFSDVFENIRGMCKKFKDAVIDVFDMIKEGIKKPINAILGFIESMVNGIISGLNKMIGAMNKLSFDVPDWVPGIGGNTFGFNIKELKEISIPKLAQGAVIPPSASNFLAMLGDNNKESEVVSPLSTIEQALRNVMKEQNVNVTFQVEGDPNGLFRVVRKKSVEYTQRTGASAFA